MQRPRICHVPEFVTSAGEEAIELARLAGLELDEWQRFVLFNALGERADGKWAARTVGLTVARQNGKGPHSLDTPILTTDGWTTMGEIAASQHVYGSDGQPTRVVARSDVFLGERCYDVGFTDGSHHVVGGGHLWRVRRKDDDARGWRAVDTETLSRSVGKRRTDNERMEYNWRVRCDAVPDTPATELPFDPYLFGYWLGDGTATSATITAGHADREWLEGRLARAGATIVRVSTHAHGNAVGIRFRIDAKMRDGFESRCKRLGVWGAKHIPECYLSASIEQRRMLLAGLMDSDGSIAITNQSPQVEFTSSYPALADGFMRLARSLGIRVCRRSRTTARRDNDRFLWTPTFNPFEMPRKAARFVAPTSRRHELMSITSIEPVPSVPTRCIQVANADGVYLVGHHFTPTHNSVLEARELVGLFLLGEKLINHTAHQQKTATSHFKRLLRLIESVPEFERRVMKAPKGKGNEAIELRGGQEIFFATRAGGGGRGLTADLQVYDEAMYLTEQDRSSLAPTMAALSMHGNIQTWYVGSAVDQDDSAQDGVPFAQVRESGLGKSRGVAYFEFSAPGENPDGVTAEIASDPAIWAMANPGLGIRISHEWVEHERTVELGARSFAVERLGIGDWPATDGTAAAKIPAEAWAACADDESEADDPVVVVFDVTPSRSASAIGAAGWRDDGLPHVEIIASKPGTGWVAGTLAKVCSKQRVTAILYDDRGPSASLVTEIATALEDAHLDVELVPVSAKELGEACGMLFDAVDQKKVRHLGTTELAQAVAGAATRPLGDAWAWARKSSSVNIAPLVACTLALWGLKTVDAGGDGVPLVAFV